MTTTQIIEALIPAHLSIRFGKDMSASERDDAVKALRAVSALSGAERVSIHEAVVKAANLCAGA